MNIRFLKTIFVILIVLFLIILALIVIIDEPEAEFGGFKEITGAVQTYEIANKLQYHNYNPTKTTDKYDKKYLAYLDSIEDSRDKTFMR